ncbi:MAG: hypothetical protein ABFS17_05235 [Chloroflexota bacterium]
MVPPVFGELGWLCYNTYDMEVISEHTQEESQLSAGAKWGIGIAAVVLLAGMVGTVYYLLLETSPTARIRDIFVIFLGFELLVIGFSAILLIIQSARLFNMFQNEIKPVLDDANEAISTIRGTAIFLSDTMAQPAIKISSFFTTIRSGLDLFKNTFGK